jgi:hypothetical protein
MYAISLTLVRTLVATLSLLGVITCTKAALAQQSYTLDREINALTVKNHFFQINDIAVDSQGRIFVLDSQNLKVHVSDMDGTWLFAIDLVVEDRNAGSLLLNTEGTVSVVTGRYESTRYIGTIRSYSLSGVVTNVMSLEDPDGTFSNAIRLSDGTIAAWGSKRPNIPTVWLFDSSLNLIRTFALQTAPGYGAGPLFAGLNGNLHYATGNGTVVEVTNTGVLVRSFTISLPALSYVGTSSLVEIGVGRFLVTLYNGYLLEVNDSGTIIRQLLAPSMNGERGINKLVKYGTRLVLSQYSARENKVTIHSIDGTELKNFGRKLYGTTAGTVSLMTLGWDDYLYALNLIDGNQSGQRSVLVRLDLSGEVLSSVNPDVSDPHSGSGMSLGFDMLPVAVDGQGRLSTSWATSNVAQITRFGSDGSFLDDYSIVDFYSGLGNQPVFVDSMGNLYFNNNIWFILI